MPPTAQAVKAGEAFWQIHADDRPLVRGLKTISNTIAAQGKKIQAFEQAGKAAFMKLSLGVAAVAAPLGLVAGKFTDFGDKFEKMSYRTGMDTEMLSEYAYAAEQCGASVEDLEGAIKGMQGVMLGAAQGKSKSVDLLNLLGLSYEQLARLDPEKQFEMIAGRVADIEDPTLRAAMAMKVFGGAGAKLLPLLDAGADGIADMREEAKLFGVSLSGEDAKNAAELSSAMTRVKKAILGVSLALGAALAPVLIDVFNNMAPMIAQITDFIKSNQELVTTIVTLAAKGATLTAGMFVLGFAFKGLVGPVASIGKLLMTLVVPALGLVKAAAIAVASILGAISAPVWGIVAAVAAVVGSFLYFSGVGGVLLRRLKEGFAALYDGFMKSFGAIINAIMAGDWQAAWDVAWTGLKALWSAGLQWLWDTLAESFTVGMAFVQECFQMIGEMFLSLVEYIFGADVASWFRETGAVIMETLGVAFEWIVDAWSMVSTAFLNGLSYVWEFIQIWVTRVVYLFNFLFGKYFEYVGHFVKTGFELAKNIGSFVYNVMQNIGSILSWIVGKVQAVIGFVIGFYKTVFSEIYKLGKPVFDWLAKAASMIADGFKAGFTVIWNIVKSLIASVSQLAGWALKFIDRLTGADKKIAEIQDKAQLARGARVEGLGAIGGAGNELITDIPALSDHHDLPETVTPYSLAPSPSPLIPFPELDGLDDLIDTGGLKVQFDDTAIQDWENALARANAAGTSDGLDLPGVDTNTTRRLRGLALNDTVKESKDKIDSVGTFSAFAAASLDNSGVDKMIEKQDETNRLLRQMRRDGGKGFAFV